MVPFGKCISFKNGELTSVCRSLGIWGGGVSGYQGQGEKPMMMGWLWILSFW